MNEPPNDQRLAEILLLSYPHALAAARRRGLTSIEAEDIVGDVILDMFEKSRVIVNTEHARRRFLRAVGNKSIDFNRKKSKQKTELSLTIFPEKYLPSYTHEEPESNESLCLLEALPLLPPQYRIVLTLINCDELSFEEAAEKLNITVGAFRGRYFRAREQIKEILLVLDNNKYRHYLC